MLTDMQLYYQAAWFEFLYENVVTIQLNWGMLDFELSIFILYHLQCINDFDFEIGNMKNAFNFR